MKAKTYLRSCLVASITAVSLTASPVALADWTGGLEGGTVFRDGGTATRLRLKMENQVRPFSHYIYADWLRGGSGENSYEAGYRPRYWFEQNLYAFGDGSVRVDNPLSIDRQQQLALGVGYQLAPRKDQFLWAEAGVGKQRTEFLDASESEDTLGLLRGGFNQVLSKILRLELDADLRSSERLSQATAEASIAMRIPAGSVKFSYRIRRISPDGGETIEDNDSFVSFSYGF